MSVGAVWIQNLVLIFLLIAAGWDVYRGWRLNNVALLNWGLVVAIGAIIFKAFNMDIEFWARGVLCILLGLLLFAINYVIIRKNREAQ